MGLDLLLFCALAFASQGVHGFAHNNLVETVENLQKQLKLLSNVVDRLEADNDALNTRVKALEELQVGKAGEHDRAYNSLEVDAVDPEKIDMHVLSDLKSSKYRYENEPHKWSSYESQNMDKYSVDRKRIGKLTNQYLLMGWLSLLICQVMNLLLVLTRHLSSMLTTQTLGVTTIITLVYLPVQVMVSTSSPGVSTVVVVVMSSQN
nr:uncharacterized protein LOC117687687 isoform X2 [Crassostrea gigas]